MTQKKTGMEALAEVAKAGSYEAGADADNNDRAALAAEVLGVFARQTGLEHSGESADTMMVDLVTDLMHLCDSLETDFAAIIRVAAMHFGDEAGDDG